MKVSIPTIYLIFTASHATFPVSKPLTFTRRRNQRRHQTSAHNPQPTNPHPLPSRAATTHPLTPSLRPWPIPHPAHLPHHRILSSPTLIHLCALPPPPKPAHPSPIPRLPTQSRSLPPPRSSRPREESLLPTPSPLLFAAYNHRHSLETASPPRVHLGSIPRAVLRRAVLARATPDCKFASLASRCGA